MHFDYDSLARFLVAAVTAIVAAVGLFRGPGGLRSNLRHDIEMLEKLPAGSPAQVRMLEYVDGQVERFTKLEANASRDLPTFFLCFAISVGFSALALWLGTHDGLWWKLGAYWSLGPALLALPAVFDSAQRVPRDEHRKRIKAAETP